MRRKRARGKKDPHAREKGERVFALDVPGIPASLGLHEYVDGRDKPGHDESTRSRRLLPPQLTPHRQSAFRLTSPPVARACAGPLGKQQALAEDKTVEQKRLRIGVLGAEAVAR